MKHTRGRVVEVESLAELDRRLARGATVLSGWRVRGVDLTERGAELARCDVAGASFLGCTFDVGDYALIHWGASAHYGDSTADAVADLNDSLEIGLTSAELSALDEKSTVVNVGVDTNIGEFRHRFTGFQRTNKFTKAVLITKNIRSGKTTTVTVRRTF